MPESWKSPEAPTPPTDPVIAWHAELPAAPPPPRDRYWLHILLFLATLVTTTYFGASAWVGFVGEFSGRPVVSGFRTLAVNGLWFSVPLLAILTAHEFGHYLACRYYRIRASLPYFLPLPLPPPMGIGTLGAVIRIRQPITEKAQVFDVGVAGPFAGFLVAVPALIVGLTISNVAVLPPDFTGLELGEPLFFKFAEWLVWGDIPEPLSLNLHPMALAAWFGLLVTALNLLPVGQLDGGHIAYAALGRHSLYVTIGTIAVALGLCFYSASWILWTVLLVAMLSFFGWRHPPTWDDHVPLDRTRLWLALLAFVIFVVCFTPAPIEPLDLIRPQ